MTEPGILEIVERYTVFNDPHESELNPIDSVSLAAIKTLLEEVKRLNILVKGYEGLIKHMHGNIKLSKDGKTIEVRHRIEGEWYHMLPTDPDGTVVSPGLYDHLSKEEMIFPDLTI